MQYILPLVVNDRRSHFLSLKYQLLGCENFIAVHQNGTTSIPLFKFNKSKKIQTLKRGTSDISLGDVKIIVVPDCPEYEFEIKISSALVTPQSKSDFSFFPGSKTVNKKTTGEKTETHKCKNNTLSIETTETETEFIVNFLTQPRLNDGQNLRIKFSYADGAEVFASAIEVILAPDANFVHAGLDFGSEASQLKYAKWARRTLKIEDFALFESLKLSENENGDNSAYVQYEKNTDFLKSVFFCKKKLSDFDEDLPSSVLDDLKLITRQDAINNGGYKDYYQLPNLKIAHKYSDSFKELSFSVPTSKGIRIKKMNDMKEVLYPAILQKIVTVQQLM